MSVKIGLISDIHATPAPLREALEIFRKSQVDRVLCAGDIAGYGTGLAETVEVLMESEAEIILGNHDLWFLDNPGNKDEMMMAGFFRKLPFIREFTCAGKRLYLVHGCPGRPLGKGIRLLDQDGKIVLKQKEQWARYLESFACDILIVGHTHQVFAEKLGRTMVINPGSTAYNHTCAILHLPEMALGILPLSNQTPKMSWNWGMERNKKAQK